jgi:hypothetical protein
MELINGSIVNEAWVTSSSNSECIPHGGERKANMQILLHFRMKKLVLASGLSGIPTDFARLRWNREYFSNPPSERGLEFNH